MASRSQAQLPLSRHPLFPMVVALWFAALLGLGSLAIRASVLERIVLATHLDLAIPAAAPPLGFTARMLLSLVLTCGGALLGYVLARRIGQSAAAAPAARRTRAAAPVVVADAAPDADSYTDDGEDLARLEAARADQPRRRRALTAEDDTAPAAPLELAPLPGSAGESPVQAPVSVLTPRVLNFGDLEPMPPLDAPIAVPTESGPESAHPASAPVRRPAAPPALAPLPLAASAPLDGNAARRLCEAPLDSLGVVELVERFALALAARRARPAAALAAAATHDLARPFDLPAELLTSGLTLGSTDLPGPAPAPLPPAFSTVDSAVEDWGGDDADLPEDEFSSLLDMKPSVRTTIAVAAEHPAALPGDIAGTQPVVIFPGQALGGPGNLAPQVRTTPATGAVATEQALREALTTLQRMSGAA